MKVLHISTFDTGDAARATLRWHAELKEAGVDSRVLCFQKRSDDSDVFAPSLLADRTESIKSRATQERWIDRCRTSYSDNFFSHPFYAHRLIGEELVEWAEVLHFHWISRSFDISSLVELSSRGKALVLTPHDLWTITGGCHYPASCQKFRESCRACPMVTEESQRLVEISHRFKREDFLQNVHALICPSTWIRNEFVRCPGFEAVDSFVIPYAWDAAGLWAEQKETARANLNIPSDRKWVLFVVDDPGESKAGFPDFHQLIRGTEERLRATGSGNAFGVLVAASTEEIYASDFGVPVTRLGSLNDVTDRRNAFSAADLLVYTGLEDNLPSVIIESLVCGTPVIGYATGGVGELVRSGENGELAAVGDIEGLTSSLVDLLMNPIRIAQLAARARKFVEIKLDNQKIVQDLCFAYGSAISKVHVKEVRPNVSGERAEYQAFAVRAVADLLESAEKRRVELDREVVWLREQLESLRATLEQSFREIVGSAEQREAALDGEVRWLREHINVEWVPLKTELGNLREILGNLREILERSFREIDEMFSMSPERVRRRYAEIANPNDPGKPDISGGTIEEKWKEAVTKISLLKEFFGRRSHRFFRPW